MTASGSFLRKRILGALYALAALVLLAVLGMPVNEVASEATEGLQEAVGGDKAGATSERAPVEIRSAVPTTAKGSGAGPTGGAYQARTGRYCGECEGSMGLYQKSRKR